MPGPTMGMSARSAPKKSDRQRGRVRSGGIYGPVVKPNSVGARIRSIMPPLTRGVAPDPTRRETSWGRSAGEIMDTRSAIAQDPNEPFDVIHADGTPTGRVKTRAEIHRDGDWHR